MIKAKRRAAEVREPPIEIAWAIESPQLQRVFVILCARYGVTPYRPRRQRTSTFNIKVPRSWGEEVLRACSRSCALVGRSFRQPPKASSNLIDERRRQPVLRRLDCVCGDTIGCVPSHGGSMIARWRASSLPKVAAQYFGASSMTRLTGQSGAKRKTCSKYRPVPRSIPGQRA